MLKKQPDSFEAPLKYATAKIVLAGEAGVGKTDLALRLALGTIEHKVNKDELQSWVIEVVRW